MAEKIKQIWLQPDMKSAEKLAGLIIEEYERKYPEAVVAVARHLAEATSWVLKKREPYRERDDNKPVSSNQK